PAFKTADHNKVPQLMARFMLDYNKILANVRNVLDVLSLCAFAYNQFLHIHPFEDGNSRTSKLIAMHIINIFNIEGLSNFPPSLDYTFINLTKGAEKRNDNDLRDLFEEMYVMVLGEQELKKMQR
ncbi:Fic family protein, partial [bacterium]|nr:Fic family protein [bacterium]